MPEISATPPPGLCPSCEAPGPVGTPCAERVCERQGIAFIPEPEARAALATASGDREALIGRYVGDFLITRRLGKGGSGRVLLGLQRPLFKLQGAIKLLEFHGGDPSVNEALARKFEGEAGSLAVLHSPHVVRLLQFGTFDSRPFMAMEFIPGGRTLRHLAGLPGDPALTPLPHDTIRRIVAETLSGLEAAHAQGIVHRDVKPDNIMLQDVVGNPHFVKIVDFGLAKSIAANTETSHVFGTIRYMAPRADRARPPRPLDGSLRGRRHRLRAAPRPPPIPGRRLAVDHAREAEPSLRPSRQRQTWRARARGHELLPARPRPRPGAALPERRVIPTGLARPLRHAGRRAGPDPLTRVSCRVGPQPRHHPRRRPLGCVSRPPTPPLAAPPERAPALAPRSDVHRHRRRRDAPDRSTVLELQPAAAGTALPIHTGAPPELARAARAPHQHRARWPLIAGVGLTALGIATAVLLVAALQQPAAEPTAAFAEPSTERGGSPSPLSPVGEPPQALEPVAGPVEPRPAADHGLPPQPTRSDLPHEAPSVSPPATAAATTVAVTISSVPDGAEVPIDGARVGKSPFVLRSEAGRSHRLRLEAPSHTPSERTLIAATDTPDLQIVLEPEAPRRSISPRRRPRATEADLPPSPDRAPPPKPEPGPLPPIYIDE